MYVFDSYLRYTFPVGHLDLYAQKHSSTRVSTRALENILKYRPKKNSLERLVYDALSNLERTSTSRHFSLDAALDRKLLEAEDVQDACAPSIDLKKAVEF